MCKTAALRHKTTCFKQLDRLNATGSAAVPNTIDGVRLESWPRTISSVHGVRSGQCRVRQRGPRSQFRQCKQRPEGETLIGTDPTGLTAIGKRVAGHSFAISPRSNVRIGGSSTAARNLISGNGQNGIILDGGSSNSVVLGNYIEPTRPVMLPISNSASGVRVIGPWQYGRRIAGGRAKLDLRQQRRRRDLSNGRPRKPALQLAIGSDSTSATAALANTGSGVRISGSSGIRVGVPPRQERNVIAGNSFKRRDDRWRFVEFRCVGQLHWNQHQRNAAIPNLAAGVRMAGPSNTVVAQLASERNVISGKRGNGVLIDTTTAVNKCGEWQLDRFNIRRFIRALAMQTKAVRITNASRARVGGSSPARNETSSPAIHVAG